MLRSVNRAGKPVDQKIRDDAAVVGRFAVIVASAFPCADRGQMRWFHRGHLPSVHGVIRDTVKAHLAAGPRLYASPFNALVKIFRFPWRPGVDVAGRTASAT